MFRPERRGQQFPQRPAPVGRLDQQRRAAVLVQQLPAPTTRRQQLPVVIHAGERDQPPAAGPVQLGHQPALGAQGQSIGGVLNVAPSNNSPVVHIGRRPHRVSGVRRISPPHRLDSSRPQRAPIHIHLPSFPPPSTSRGSPVSGGLPPVREPVGTHHIQGYPGLWWV